MVFQLVAAIAAEVAVFTFSVGMEVQSALSGRSNLGAAASERNKAQAENIKLTHQEYEQLALDAQKQEEMARRQEQLGGVAPLASSSSLGVSSICCLMLIMMMTMAASS
jgi:hypothetical protein